MTAYTTVEAVDIVAKRLIEHLVSLEWYGGEAWEDFPEIGEDDWQAVIKQVAALVDGMNPPQDVFQEAYNALAARADPV